MPRIPTKIYSRKKKRKSASQGAINFAYQQTNEGVGYWIAGSPMGEYVQSYQRAGATMHFTKERGEAARTTDVQNVDQWVKIANEVYKRRFKREYVVGESALSEEFSVPANPSAVHWDLTTSGVPIWDELMKDPKYYQDRKGMTAEVEWMTPDQYFDLLPKVFAYQYSHNAIKTATDPKKVEKYAALMRKGVKFPMLWIEWWNAKEGCQEGRHRALAAEKAGIQFVPVIIIKRDQPKSNEAVDAAIDSLLETELSYYDIGHADDLGKSNNFLWMWDKGHLLSKPGEGLNHEDVFGNAQPQWFGRYDPSTKQVSITSFVRGKNICKLVPNIIVKRLYNEYGDNITIHPFGCELSESA